MATLVLMLMPGEGRGEGEKCLNQLVVGWLVDRFAPENTLTFVQLKFGHGQHTVFVPRLLENCRQRTGMVFGGQTTQIFLRDCVLFFCLLSSFYKQGRQPSV